MTAREYLLSVLDRIHELMYVMRTLPALGPDAWRDAAAAVGDPGATQASRIGTVFLDLRDVALEAQAWLREHPDEIPQTQQAQVVVMFVRWTLLKLELSVSDVLAERGVGADRAVGELAGQLRDAREAIEAAL